MLNKIKKALWTLLVAWLVVFTLSLQPMSVRAEDDTAPTPTPTQTIDAPMGCGGPGC